MGKAIHLLAFAALLLGVTLTGATSIAGSSDSDSYSDSDSDSDSSSEEYCDTQCPANEQYDPCDNPCPARRCDFDPTVVRCAAPPKLGDPACLVGCRCIDGYLRNAKGVCVPKDQCDNTKPKTCELNEILVECPITKCIPKTCDQLGFQVACPAIACSGVFGCICKDGYLRNSDGVCIPQEQCPSCGGDSNAKPGCGINCGRKCSDLGNSGPRFCPLSCRLNGCDCKDGYYFDEKKNKCVLPSECTTQPTCRANEVFSSCANGGCRRRKCTDLDGPILCIDPLNCEPGCICAEGYYLDANGNCVSEEQCRQVKCSKQNEVYDQCFYPCLQATCDYTPRPELVKCPCVPGCRCSDGYVRNKDGDCIRKEKCATCKENEVYNDCPDTYCLIKSCSDLGFPIKCKEKPKDGSCPGKPGCICAPGYARDSKGKCIKIDQCPSCGGDKNAQRGCGNCGKQCTDVGKKGPFRCPPACIYNGCKCRDGFYYNSVTKKCVRPNQCPKVCQKNEVFVDCPDAACQPKTCKEVGFPVACPSYTECPSKPGCICAGGYVRNSKGVCVPATECPSCGGDKNAKVGCGTNCGKKCSDVGKKGPFNCPIGCSLYGCDCKDGFYYDEDKKKCVPPRECPSQKCKKNEIFVECPEGECLPKTCKEVGFPVACPGYTECPSKPGCICAGGYVRNSNGVCVPATECPSCGGDKNAKVGCGTNCGKKCSDVGKKGPFNCPLGCSLYGCDCKDGFYYDEDKKKCVRPHECPYACKENEVYNDCPDTYCLIKSCSDLGFPIKCKEKPKDGSCPGKPGCICAPGYARDSKGKCIKIDQCPSCGGDKNAQPGCGNCGKLCTDVGKKPPFRCPRIACIYNGCKCRDGFYYNSVTRKCVRPNQCPKACQKNEVFVDCPDAACQPKTCKEVGFPVACPMFTKCPSKPGCICAGGYVRNSKGECVPASECPSCRGDENAKVGCGTNCGKKCSDVGKKPPFNCPIGCSLYGCDCKDGFYYDEDKKKCVPPNQCPGAPCDDEHERK